MTTRTDGRSSPKAPRLRLRGDERILAGAAALLMLTAGAAAAQSPATPDVAVTRERIVSIPLRPPLTAENIMAQYEAYDRRTSSMIRWSRSEVLAPMLPGAVMTATPDAPLTEISGRRLVLKDNIETADMPTTAGSLALANNAPGRDAPIVARLRAARVILLGKANLSEWANIRSNNSISGWSAVGGQTRNPYDLERTPCGSSSGSAVAVATGLAELAIGTETDGSITCPASVNGVVGFKPTVGLVSRTHIVPISHSQDTAGPMTRTVTDAALILTAIAGSDPADPATKEADARKTDYAKGLSKDALKGVTLAVARFYTGYSPGTDAVFEQALKDLKAQGATLVDVKDFDEGPIGKAEGVVLYTELKVDLNAYLASTDPAKVKTRTLEGLIAFNEATPKELEWFGQESFIKAQATKGYDDPEYIKALADGKRLAGPEQPEG